MIVAEQKSIEEIAASIEGFNKVVIASCGTCVTVCMAGGEKEAHKLQGLLQAADSAEDILREITVVNLKRQCDHEFIDDLMAELQTGDVILSLACGVGVQFLSEKFADKPVVPGLDTKFYGASKALGHWAEYCQGCGNCLLERTCGICPITRCSKSNFNGPCGGSQKGKCEVDTENIDCGWQLIYDRIKSFGKLGRLATLFEYRDWRTSRDGGPRTVRRDDVIV